MRKLYVSLLVIALAFSFIAPVLAVNFPAADEVIIYGKGRAPDGTTAPVTVVKVRYGRGLSGGEVNEAGLSSGDVVIWDVTSADGYTISAVAIATVADGTYAGVLVTDIATADTTVVRGFGRNIGYMAIKGYCLARTDSGATAGDGLVTAAAADIAKGFTTKSDTVLSRDIGVCLLSPGSDGLTPVWLR